MTKQTKSATAPRRISHTSGRRARRRAETRERIFRSALRLFAQRGFLNTTVEDITEAADVGKGTFFNYFPSKGHVLQALAEIQLGNVAAALEDAREGQDSIQTVLSRLTKALTREPGRSPALVRSLLMAVHSSDPVRELVTARLASGRELLVELMEIGQRRGEIRRDFHVVALARIFQQQIFGMLMIWTLHPPADLQSWVEQTFAVFWSGIRA
ncbi:MAG: TetR/AcrR family transcriptional regulator [Candidatus Acidiferrales bacterium]